MIKNFILTILFLGVFQFAHSQTTKAQILPKNSTTETEGNEEADQEFKYTRWYKLMQKPHADYFKIQKMYQRYMKRHPQGEGPRETGEDWFKENIYYLDSRGRVQAPPLVDYLHLRAGTASTSTVTDTMAGDWHMVGPRDITAAGDNTRGGYSHCVRMDPTNTQKMFISFMTGGLWVSADGGTTWHLTDANMPNNEYFNIVVCAANTNIVYAISKAAVIKSTDGGQTWAVTGLNSSVAAYASTQGYDIIVAPDNPNIAVARWGNSLYRTNDGGATWTSVLSSLKSITQEGYTNANGRILEWNRNNTGQLFYIDAAYGTAAATIYSSTDQGATFSSLANITIPADVASQSLSCVELVSTTDQPNSVWAFLNSGNLYLQLYKINATTGADTLFRKNLANNQQCDVAAMDINHCNNIIFGGYGHPYVNYSTDTGKTIAQSGQMHYDIRSIDMVNGQAMVGNDGGTTVSTNGGATFSSVSAGISNIELWGFSSSFKSDILAAGCNHGPLMIRDYAAKGGWYDLEGADQQNTNINPLDSVHVLSRGYGVYYVQRTGIKTFTSVNPGAQVDPGREDWFNNQSYHPNLFNTIESHTAPGNLAGDPTTTTEPNLTRRESLIRSNDNGFTINTIVHTFTDRLMSEKICMTDTNRIYCIVSPSSNHLWKTTNGGTTWTEITPSTTVTGTGVRNISDVAVSDVNPNEIWVTYSGVQSTCKVLHSTDGGVTYTNLTTATLGASPILKIVFQRGTNGGVYLGNGSGVFYRNNTLSDWQMIGNGLPMLEVRNMFINYYEGKLLIGTSRGAWDHALYEHSATSAQISAGTNTPSCEYPTVQFRDYSVVSNGGSGATYSWQFPGGIPSTSTSETPLVSYRGDTTGKYDVTLTVTDQYGTSTQKLTKFINYNAANCCQASAPGWSTEDIGSPSIAGSTCYQPALNRFTVQASGGSFFGSSDQFRLNDTTLNGDGQIIAKVTSLSGSNSFALAGVMIRETTDANSKYAFVAVTPGNGVNMLYRNATGGSMNSVQDASAKTTTAPYWVKLVRQGNLFSAYASPDGANWTLFDTTTVAMNASVRVGLALTNHDNTQLATAIFDNILISRIPPAVTITSPANNALYATGSNITINTATGSPDAGGSIAKVDFYNGSTLLGTSTASPFSFTWNNVAKGLYSIKAIATDNGGLTNASNIVNIDVGEASFAPVADAYVRNGSYATSNFGTATTMLVKDDGTSYYRESYLRFDFNTYTGTSVDSAKFNIYASNANTGSRVVSVYGVADTTWGETTITYNNQPTDPGTLIGNFTVSSTSGVWYQWAVTSYINSQLAAGHRKVSFRLIDNGPVSSTSDVTFNSREAGTNMPQLLLFRNPPEPPTISITTPATNTIVATGSNITINATAGSPITGGSIAKVDFYNGKTLLGTSTTSPYSYTWNSVTNGTDTLTAVATDNKGLTTTSSAIIVVVSTPPTVSITTPANNAVVATGSNITISANAGSPDTGGSIAKVDFYNGAALLGTFTTAPYSYTWNNVPSGTDTLKAIATDNNGLITTSSAITVVVSAPPTVSITAPANNTVVATGSNVTISANAGSPNAGGSIAKVDFYNGFTLLGTSTTASYSYTWNNVINGTDSLTAVATDNNGLMTTSSTITVVVSAPPTVSITAPANNAVVATGSNITISANAGSPNSGGSIAKIDFYQGSTLLGTSTTSPYSYAWNNLSAGTDTLKAIATDNNGLTTTSSSIVITVSNPPVVSLTAPSNNSTVMAGSNVTLNADASSPNTGGSITRVDFYNGSTLLGTSTTAPYNYAWNNLPAGTDTLTAVATDNNGLSTTSAPVIFNVALNVSIPDVYALNPAVDNKNTIYMGYGPTALTLTASAQGGQGYSYSWSNGANTASTSISQAGIYTVTVFSAGGGKGSASIAIDTLDVRCGNDSTKVQVCHNQHTICVAQSAVQAHLDHGDKLGACVGTAADAHLNVPDNTLTDANTDNTNKIEIYPNPVGDILHIAVPKLEANATIHVYSYSAPGKEVRNIKFKQAKQDISFQGLAPGYYFLVIKNGNQTVNRTIIKN